MDSLSAKGRVKIEAKSIAYNSPEFQQAAQIRYDLFFAEHDLPWSITQQTIQASYLHAAIMHDRTVVAYGQLAPSIKGDAARTCG